MASVVAILFAAALAAVLLRRNRSAAFALLWVALAIAPVSNVVLNAGRPLAQMRCFAATIPFAILIGLAFAAVRGVWRPAAAVLLGILARGRWAQSLFPPSPIGATGWPCGSARPRSRRAPGAPSTTTACVLGEGGKYAASVEHLRHAHALDPQEHKTMYNLALSLYHLRDFAEAEEFARKGSGRAAGLHGGPADS